MLAAFEDVNIISETIIIMNKALASLTVLIVLPHLVQALPAFPGCGGFGCSQRHAYTTDSTPDVYFINTLDCTAPRTTRADHSAQGWMEYNSGYETALQASGARIVVFEVSGELACSAAQTILVDDDDLFVAGQTAPFPGVMVTGNRVHTVVASNIVFQHLRMFPGGEDGTDSEQASEASKAYTIGYGPYGALSNIVMDHISALYGIDSSMAIFLGNGVTSVSGLSITYNLIADPLHWGSHPESHHGMAGSIAEMTTNPTVASNISASRNLLANNHWRNWLLRTDEGVFVNNVIYNWDNTRGAFNVRDNSDPNNLDADYSMEGNYFKRGPESSSYNVIIDISSPVDAGTDIYAYDNYFQNPDTTYNNGDCNDPWIYCYYSGTFTESLSRTPAYPTGEEALTIVAGSNSLDEIKDKVGAYPLWRTVNEQNPIDDVIQGTGYFKACVDSTDIDHHYYDGRQNMNSYNPTTKVMNIDNAAANDPGKNSFTEYGLRTEHSTQATCTGIIQSNEDDNGANWDLTVAWSTCPSASETSMQNNPGQWTVSIVRRCSWRNAGGWPVLAQNTRTLTLPANPHTINPATGYTNLEEWLHVFSCEVEGPGSPSCLAAPPTCSEGQITSTCLCGGIEYSSGYCCSEVWQDTPCQTSKTYTVLRAQIAPTVDGNCQEFQGANEIVLTPDNGSNVGSYRLIWDDSSLYMCGEVSDSELNANYTERDESLWRDDSKELFFDTQNDRGTGQNSDDYKLFANIFNAQRDSNALDASWNATWSSSVITSGTINDNGDTDTGYSIEMRISWAEWGISSPSNGTIWGFDIKLNDKDATDKYSKAWSNSNGGSVNDPDGWGEAVFSDLTVATVFSTVDPYLGNSLNWESLNPSRWKVVDDRSDLRYGIITTDYTNLSGSRLGEYSLIKGRSYENFIFNASVRSTDNLGSNPSADYDIIFGYQDPNNYYYMMFNSNPMNSDLFKVVNGNREHVADSTDFAVPDNNYHDVALERVGDSVKVFFDGALVLDAMDSTFATGRVGIGSFNDASLWDDITVKLFHRADTNQDGCIDLNELLAFIDRWKISSQDVPMPELMEAIGLWNTGTGCP
jgi:hypothetical protein